MKNIKIMLFATIAIVGLAQNNFLSALILTAKDLSGKDKDYDLIYNNESGSTYYLMNVIEDFPFADATVSKDIAKSRNYLDKNYADKNKLQAFFDKNKILDMEPIKQISWKDVTGNNHVLKRKSLYQDESNPNIMYDIFQDVKYDFMIVVYTKVHGLTVIK